MHPLPSTLAAAHKIVNHNTGPLARPQFTQSLPSVRPPRRVAGRSGWATQVQSSLTYSTSTIPTYVGTGLGAYAHRRRRAGRRLRHEPVKSGRRTASENSAPSRCPSQAEPER